MDNEQLAKAIGAMYRNTSLDDGMEWTDTDEAIQKAAFGLWNVATCNAEDMSVLLMKNSGLTTDTIACFCDITIGRVISALRQHYAERVVTPVTDICDECGGDRCDCIPPAAMAALLERIDADPHGHNDLSNLGIPF
jgi:hypothetical protein